MDQAEPQANLKTDVTAEPKVSLFRLLEGMPPFREKPTFPEWFGARLASRLLLVIMLLAVTLVLAWWMTRPSLAEVQSILGTSANPKDVVETLRTLRRDHFENFGDLFQLIVLSGLVPLFTLLAGYAFGSRQRQRDDDIGKLWPN